MELIKKRIKLSDQEAVLELETLKASLGWAYIHNWLVDEIERMGEVILDDLVEQKLDPEERKKLELERYQYKQLLQLPDKMQEVLRSQRESAYIGEQPDYDPYEQKK